jgi:ribosomal 50S subunit-associated protein YjgA (DUF615 family)
MTEKALALRLADALILRHGIESFEGDSATELRRLHEVEQQRNELLAALKLALNAHGVMLMSDPPKDAWRAYGVEQTARAAIAKAEGEK